MFWSKYMSHHMGKPTICIGENKGAYQLRSNCEADQRLCFRYSDSTIPLLLKSDISSFYLLSVLVQVGLCCSCSETTLLVFPGGGSYVYLCTPQFYYIKLVVIGYIFHGHVILMILSPRYMQLIMAIIHEYSACHTLLHSMCAKDQMVCVNPDVQ